jgi:hypothetical protein
MRSSSVVTRSSRPARLLVVGGWLGLAFLMPGLARAHFLWLTAEGDKPTVHAFLSETPTPEAPEFLKHIEHARITSGGKALSWTKAEDTFRVNLPEPRPDMVDGFCDLGVKTRGGTSFNLIYTARVQFGPLAAGAADEADHLRMRLVARSGQAPVIVVRFRGQPASGVQHDHETLSAVEPEGPNDLGGTSVWAGAPGCRPRGA